MAKFKASVLIGFAFPSSESLNARARNRPQCLAPEPQGIALWAAVEDVPAALARFPTGIELMVGQRLPNQPACRTPLVSVIAPSPRRNPSIRQMISRCCDLQVLLGNGRKRCDDAHPEERTFL